MFRRLSSYIYSLYSWGYFNTVWRIIRIEENECLLLTISKSLSLKMPTRKNFLLLLTDDLAPRQQEVSPLYQCFYQHFATFTTTCRCTVLHIQNIKIQWLIQHVRHHQQAEDSSNLAGEWALDFQCYLRSRVWKMYFCLASGLRTRRLGRHPGSRRKMQKRI